MPYGRGCISPLKSHAQLMWVQDRPGWQETGSQRLLSASPLEQEISKTYFKLYLLLLRCRDREVSNGQERWALALESPLAEMTKITDLKEHRRVPFSFKLFVKHPAVGSGGQSRLPLGHESQLLNFWEFYKLVVKFFKIQDTSHRIVYILLRILQAGC